MNYVHHKMLLSMLTYFLIFFKAATSEHSHFLCKTYLPWACKTFPNVGVLHTLTCIQWLDKVVEKIVGGSVKKITFGMY